VSKNKFWGRKSDTN